MYLILKCVDASWTAYFWYSLKFYPQSENKQFSWRISLINKNTPNTLTENKNTPKTLTENYRVQKYAPIAFQFAIKCSADCPCLGAGPRWRYVKMRKCIPLNRYSAVHQNFLSNTVFKLLKCHQKSQLYLVKQLFYCTHAQSGTKDARPHPPPREMSVRPTLVSNCLVLSSISTWDRLHKLQGCPPQWHKVQNPFSHDQGRNAVELGLVFWGRATLSHPPPRLHSSPSKLKNR